MLDPGVADHLTRQAADASQRQENLGHPACLLVPDSIRPMVARLLKRAAPRLKVLGHSEIPETHSDSHRYPDRRPRMNVKRFIGRNSREAMQKVKAAFGDDAVVLSTKPAPEGGIEILAMAADSVPAIDSYPPLSAPSLKVRPEPVTFPVSPTRWRLEGSRTSARSRLVGRGHTGQSGNSVQDDVKQLAMSTLSFQDYVRASACQAPPGCPASPYRTRDGRVA